MIWLTVPATLVCTRLVIAIDSARPQERFNAALLGAQLGGVGVVAEPVDRHRPLRSPRTQRPGPRASRRPPHNRPGFASPRQSAPGCAGRAPRPATVGPLGQSGGRCREPSRCAPARGVRHRPAAGPAPGNRAPDRPPARPAPGSRRPFVPRRPRRPLPSAASGAAQRAGTGAAVHRTARSRPIADDMHFLVSGGAEPSPHG